MKIGIDARMYGSEQAGLGRYVEQLIKYLAKIDDKNQYVVFLHKKNINKLKPSLPENWKIVKADIPWYGWAEQLILPLMIKKQKLDLVHFPHWNVPLAYNEPFIVTIHDLIMYRYSRQEASTHGPLVYWLKDKLHRLIVKHAVEKAKHIITPSEYTKQDIRQTLHVTSSKISNIHLAPYTNQKIERKKAQKPFVLYVGSAYPHKNLKILLKSWQEFCEKYGDQHHLVLAGKKNYFYEKLINSEVFKKTPNLVYTDYLDDAKLEQLYSQASLYIFPSLYEGFGLPPLEAMAHGVPVVSSNSSCLPEILQSAVIYFDPNKTEEIVRALHMGLHDEIMRERLKKQAKQLLWQYSWNKTAQETLNIYCYK
ncbi:MAG: glycosyltransferase family 1 protein [bacterium]